MKISLLRSNSLGLAGTIRNINHHAQKLLPIINRLCSDIQNWGFAEWRQAHNTHVLITTDKRKFILRGVTADNEGYVGIKVEASEYIKNANGFYLFTVYHDSRNGVDLDIFSTIMATLASPAPSNIPNEKPQEDPEDPISEMV